MGSFRLSDDADQSLRGIFRFSVLSFGLEQAQRYAVGLEEALIRLVDRPEMGRRRDDLLQGLRSSHYGRHTIYYEVDDKGIYVVDVLHQSMVPERHLRRD
jgi:toxin ParE1/3/4